MGLTSRQIADVVLTINPKCLIIPAHVWTPWFSLYGSESGFDSVDEAFGDYARYIYAIETGLSSSPSMNWRIKELDSRSIVSFSDAHSGPKLGREATVFNVEELGFAAIRQAIMEPSHRKLTNAYTSANETKNRIAYTLEFYPEEGKYHYTGHRNCDVKQTPEETRKKGTICPVCGRKLTVGVMHRVDQLAGRSEEELKLGINKIDEIRANVHYSQTFANRPPFMMLVPLAEILAEAIGGLPSSRNVQNEYSKLINYFTSEFAILLSIDQADIAKISGERVAGAIDRVRKGEIYVDPGYDGVFGVVKIWQQGKSEDKTQKREQMNLF